MRLVQRLGRPSVPAWSRLPRRDLALAAGLLLLGLVEASWATSGERPLALSLMVPMTVPLFWRRSSPSAVALAITAALVIQLPWASLRLFDQTFTGFVCVVLATYALGRHGRAPWAVPVLAGCTLAVALTLGWHDRSIATFILGAVFMLAPAATGRVVAARSELHQLLDRQADMLRENAEVAERTRVAEVRGQIAGEIQQLASRRVHEMVDRSETARRIAHNDNSAAAELAATVERDGRAALEEMRTVVGVLRSTDLSGWKSPDPGAESPSEARFARHLPRRRLELLLAAALVVLVVGETLTSPEELPVVSLTMLGPLLTFAVGARTNGRAAAAGLALALAAIAVVNLLVVNGGWGDYVFPSVLVTLAWLGGRLVQEQNDLVERSRSRAAALERSTEVRAAAAATHERLRLARELHDVLAHTLMVMVVQAGAARRVLETRRGGAEEALRAIEETGRDASTELRRLLTLMDPEVDSSDAGDATPGLGELRSLVERARAAGMAADLDVEGEPVPLPGGLALAVYRVAQEAVTNVIRHAEARQVHVRLHYAPGQLRLEVRDDGRAVTPPPEPTSGNGITGMRERAQIYGGELVAGPLLGAGFVVAATFPLVPLVQEQPV